MEKIDSPSTLNYQPSAREITDNQRGLTLFEIMITLVLAGIMLTGAAFIYRDFWKNWDQDLSTLEIQRQGAFALAVMEAAIKSGVDFSIANYGSGTDNKISVTIPTPDGDVKYVDYYWDKDDAQNFKPIKEKETQVITIIPDTYKENGKIKSDLEVKDLKFFDETGSFGKSVRIALKLEDTNNYGLIFNFTTSVRLRNENVQEN